MNVINADVVWDTWKEDVSSSLTDLWQNGILCDVTLTSADTTSCHTAHSVILAAASPVLKAVLSQGMNSICVEQISYQTWKYLLEYIYTGKVVVIREELELLQAGAAQLEIPKLESTCAEMASQLKAIEAVHDIQIVHLVNELNPSDVRLIDSGVLKSEMSDNPMVIDVPILQADDTKDYVDSETPAKPETGVNPTKAIINHARKRPVDTPYTRKYPRKVRCNLCGKSFRKPCILRAHMAVHTGMKPYKCSVCQKSFVAKGGLKNHMSRHLGFKPWQCSLCEKRFTTKFGLEVHGRTHTGEKPYECKYCHKTFSMQASCKAHVLAVHTDQRPIKCDICRRQFVTQSALNMHALVHSCERPFNCKTCGDTFKDFRSCAKHEAVHQASREMFACEHCGKKYLGLAHTKEHQARCVPDDKKVSCDICNMKFKTGIALQQHKHLHEKFDKSDLPHPCQLCPRKFSKHSHLIRHIPVHQKKTCPLCLRQFTTDMALWNHQHRCHLDHIDDWLLKEKPRSPEQTTQHGNYKCTFCNTVWSTQMQLNRHHVQTHSEKKGGICSLCGKVLPSLPCLSRHEKHCKGNPQDDYTAGGSVKSERTGDSSLFKLSNSCRLCCTKCGTRFSNSGILANHRKVCLRDNETSDTDIPGPPYVCSCKKVFSGLRELKRHKKRHIPMEARKYSCHICDKRFVERWDLKVHLYGVHKIDFSEVDKMAT